MSDYISRDSITEWRPQNIEIFNSRAYIDLEELLALVDGIPAADVEPVRRGEWIIIEDEYCGYAKCSVCGDEFTSWEGDCAITPYCPNCGAKMELEEKDNEQ